MPWTAYDTAGGIKQALSSATLANLTVTSTFSLLGTMISDLLFTDGLYDIGKSGATRPRDIFTSRNATFGGALVVSGAGPHAIGGATIASTQLLLTGTFSSAQSGLRLQPTLNILTNNLGAVQEIIGTLATSSGAGVHSDFMGLRLVAPTITLNVGTITNASTLKIEGAPTGATNNYALWVAGGISRLYTLHVVDAIRVQGSSSILQFSSFAGSELARLTDSGILALGTTMTTGSGPGNLVLANNVGINGVNAAGNGAVGLIRVNANDKITFGVNRTAASVPGNFTADYYIQFQDNSGQNFYVPAKNAAW